MGLLLVLRNGDVINLSCDSDVVIWPHEEVTLHSNEVVTQVDIYRKPTGSNPFPRAVTLTTNCGSYGPFGGISGTDGSEKMEMKGYKLRGFFGRKGLILDKLGVVFDICRD